MSPIAPVPSSRHKHQLARDRVYLFRQIAVRAPADGIPGGKAQGLYYALWAFVLWVLFGSYVLAFWILGLLAYPIVRLVQRQRVA